MSRLFAVVVAAASLLVVVGGCRSAISLPDGATETPLTDARPQAPDADYEHPRNDLVPAIGSDAALDIATWNIQNFPKEPGTPQLMADLITSLAIDLVAIQEIESVDAFNELCARLRSYSSLLSTHTYGDGSYQKLGVLYHSELVTLVEDRQLFGDDAYEFPRPPLQLTIVVQDDRETPLEMTLIAVHLKAGRDSEDYARRRAANEQLDSHVRALVDSGHETEIVLLGDFNDVVTSSGGRDVFSPWLNAPDRYALRTAALADEDDFTFIPSRGILDHVISTAALEDDLASGNLQIPHLEEELLDYERSVSDHLPVVLSIPLVQ